MSKQYGKQSLILTKLDVSSKIEVTNNVLNRKVLEKDTLLGIKSEGQEEMFMFMVNHGSDIQLGYFDSDTEYMAMRQIIEEEPERVVIEYSVEATKNIVGNKQVLFTAARRGLVETVKLLVGLGADVTACDDYGQTALHYAVLREASLFTFCVPAEDRSRSTHAMEAIVRILLDRGVRVDAETVNCFTALHFAVNLRYETVVSILLEYGAKVRKFICRQINSPRMSEFSRRVDRATDSRIPVISWDYPHHNRLTTILHIAVEGHQVGVVDELLWAGAEVDCVQYDGKTPLVLAVENRDSATVQLLLDNGADPDQKNKSGMTPLHIACTRGYANCVRVLLHHGADLNAICHKGRVPYQYAQQFVDSYKYGRSFTQIREDVYENTVSFCNDHSRNSLQLMDLLHTQLRAMLLTGLPLCECNVNAALNAVIKTQFYVLEKLSRMKKETTVCGQLTLESVTKNVYNPVYVANPQVLKNLEYMATEFNKSLYFMGNILKYVLRATKKRYHFLEEGLDSFNFLCSLSQNQLPRLPNEMVWKLLCLLNDKDLQCLIECQEVLEVFALNSSEATLGKKI